MGDLPPDSQKTLILHTRIMGKVDVKVRQLRDGYTLTTVKHIPPPKPKVMTLAGWAAKHGHYIGGNDDSFAERHGFIKHGFVSRQPSRIEKPSVLALRIARDLKATELIYVTVPSCIWVWYKKSAESGETTQL